MITGIHALLYTKNTEAKLAKRGTSAAKAKAR